MNNLIIAFIIAVLINFLPLSLVTKCVIMVVIGCVFGATVSLIENIKVSRKKKAEGGDDDCTN